MEENKVELRVPLSGSKLFDINSYATARKLCAKFPGLQYEINEKDIHIFGTLTDYWYAEYNKAVFEAVEGEL